MTERVKRHDLSTFGGRLAFYRRKAGLTQKELAEKIYSTRQLVNAWETNKRNSYAEYLDRICSVLNIDENLLTNGVSVQNQTIASELGLSESSIEFLKSLKGDYYVPFSTTDADEISATSIMENFWSGKEKDYSIDIEGGYPDEMLYVINLLLSDQRGKVILALIYKYLTTHFESAFVNGECCYEIEYNTDSDRRKTLIPVELMKYSLLQAVSSKLGELRDELNEQED